MFRPVIVFGCFLAVVVTGFSTLAGDRTAEIWNQIQSARLETDKTVKVVDLELNMGMGFLRFDDGVLIPATPIGDNVGEFLFVGDARFAFAPPDPIEEAQLALFTDQSALDVELVGAVLTVGNAEIAARLLDREPAGELDEELRQRATDAFDRWSSGAERKGFGADGALLGMATGDAGARGFFAAWLRSDELGDFYYTYDPGAQEQVTLGQFIPMETDVLEEDRIRRQIKKGRRKGRFSRFSFEDLGDWDTWISAAAQGEDGQPAHGVLGFEVEHYTLDVTLAPKEETIAGTVRIDATADAAGRTIVPLTIHSDLDVTAVRDGAGRPLPAFQSRSQVYVVLSEPAQQGEKLSIELDFQGRVFFEIDATIYILLNTSQWFPRVGEVARATFDVTLRWPKRMELLASGRVVESGEDKGMSWERRTLDVPSFAFSFEVGNFDVRQVRAGRVAMTVGFSKADGSIDKGAKDEVIETLVDALAFYEEKFGAYPLDYMTVATVPRGYSQGFLGFVTLSHYLIWRPSGNYYYLVDEDTIQNRDDRRVETVSHELAHQWWGNKVGWVGYRDQWLSEALADFSSVLYTAHKAESKSVYLARHARRWQRTLTRTTAEGRAVESIGPIVLGTRLISSKSTTAYTAIVYDKGSVVFSMLTRALGEESTAEMLKTLADAVNNREISTETFIKAFERMTGLDLTTFVDGFIYGTGIPEIYYTYKFLPDDSGGWVVEGQARQVTPARFRYQLARTDNDTWHVERRSRQGQDAKATAFIVPFQVSLARPRGAKPSQKETEIGLGGQIVIQDYVNDFRIPLPKEPKRFWLDQRGEILARFFCEAREPKRMLRYQADELAGDGKFDEAEMMYRRALGAPLIPEGELDQDIAKKEIERRTRLEDSLIHLGRAGLFLEQGMDDEATAALDTAEDYFKGMRKNYYWHTRTELHSLLDVRAGDYKSAYARLSKSLRLDFQYQEDESIGAAARRHKFNSGRRWRGNGRCYALLAIAALETGHDAVGREALDEAEERGAEMGLLASRQKT